MRNEKGKLLIGLVLTMIVMVIPSLTVSAGQGQGQPHAAPIAVLNGPIYSYNNNLVTLDGSQSHTGGIWYITDYNFDTGNPSQWQGWQSSPTYQTSYPTGAYTARLKVRDNSSLESQVASQPVYVNGDTTLHTTAFPIQRVYYRGDWVSFNISVQNSVGGNCYWASITVAVYDYLLRPYQDLNPDLWASASNPLIVNNPHDTHYFTDDYTNCFHTQALGIYYVKAIAYDGSGNPYPSNYSPFTIV